MKKTVLLLSLILVSLTGFSVNPFWVKMDKKLIKKTINLDWNNPVEVEEFFINKKYKNRKQNLGFGWSASTKYKTGGYIAINANFYYYNDSLVSYTITPMLPEEKKLIEKYKNWYKDKFVNSNSELLPFKHNEGILMNLLLEYDGTDKQKNLSNSLRQYMSPNSGLVYGFWSSPNQLVSNRLNFIEIQDDLNNEQIILMMYSINPASRFTAIEYYLNHKKSFKETKKIDNWIEINFREVAEIQSYYSCYLEYWNSRDLVIMYSSMSKMYADHYKEK